jgi:hypothetical protein
MKSEGTGVSVGAVMVINDRLIADKALLENRRLACYGKLTS